METGAPESGRRAASATL